MMADNARADIEPQGNFFFQVFLLGFLTLIPLALVVLLYTTPVAVDARNALGLGLQRSPDLILYDAVCDTNNSRQRPTLTLLYWTRDPAPLTARFGDYRSPIFDSRAGLHTVDLYVQDKAGECPSVVLLRDESRGRVSSNPVEVVTP